MHTAVHTACIQSLLGLGHSLYTAVDTVRIHRRLRTRLAHGGHTAVFTARTRLLIPCTNWTVYTCTRSVCTLPLYSCACTRVVHGRDHAYSLYTAVYRPCTTVYTVVFTCSRPVYTAMYSTVLGHVHTGRAQVYTVRTAAVYRPLTRPCRRSRPVHGPVTAVYSAVWTARTRSFNGRVRVRVHCRVRAMYTTVYTDLMRTYVCTGRTLPYDGRVHGP